MAEVKLENKSARILHVSLGGGGSLAIPPQEGGITVTMDEAEKEAFDKNVATDAVQEWIAAGELIISDATPGVEPIEPPPIEPPTEPPPAEPPPAAAEPEAEHKKHKRSW
jgi:hypothetical protein